MLSALLASEALDRENGFAAGLRFSSVRSALAAAFVGSALVVSAADLSAQTCVLETGGCTPPVTPENAQQCFPVASGPAVWHDPTANHTWQYRRGLQSSANPSCEP